jgi:Iron-containing redox enzyme
MELTAPATPDLGYWPLVRPWTANDGAGGQDFVALDPKVQGAWIESLRHDPARHGALIHSALSGLYADSLGYRDSAMRYGRDPSHQAARAQARGALEEEMYAEWLAPVVDVRPASAADAAAHLQHLRRRNPGVKHALFDYLRLEATEEQMRVFLTCELIRNEVVDDEIALLLVGLQGQQKAVVAQNLWDECGHGHVPDFHTTWLRRLARGLGGEDVIYTYRETMPWFAKISSNVLMSMLLSPARHQQAYGCFLIFESWVLSHFRDIMIGLRRLKLDSPDIMVYFAEHARIDPRHSRDLLAAITEQSPALGVNELAAIVEGAETAVQTGVRQYDHMLTYLISLGPSKGDRW